tara:strand:+ start:48 stop:521 length:474 start_codon:yes stop_codon:yes gene_type:complete
MNRRELLKSLLLAPFAGVASVLGMEKPKPAMKMVPLLTPMQALRSQEYWGDGKPVTFEDFIDHAPTPPKSWTSSNHTLAKLVTVPRGSTELSVDIPPGARIDGMSASSPVYGPDMDTWKVVVHYRMDPEPPTYILEYEGEIAMQHDKRWRQGRITRA